MDSSSKKLKETLNLPRTTFPMKANLPQREPALIDRWEEQGLYRQIRESRSGMPTFVLHDGPPYANGNIHTGTALNKVLKDIVVKYKTMSGFNAAYRPGWDCHGLPIELQVDKLVKDLAEPLPRHAFRKKCREYAEKHVKIQRTSFRRLGILGEWDEPYLTMNFDYQAEIVRRLGRFFSQGAVYRGLKPVYWCADCRTALAEAEVEYHDHTSYSVYVRFPLAEDAAGLHPALSGRSVSVVIWTTTPWTLPANLAIAVHPDFEYVAVEHGEEVLVTARERLSPTVEACGLTVGDELATFTGAQMENFRCRHPFIERDSVILTAGHVTMEQGTGCVHTAPGHGQDDYVLGSKHGMEILAPVDDSGRFTSQVPEFEGVNVFKANPQIVELLRRRGMLLSGSDFEHSYPHCWRCKEPIVFRATEQWFISMSETGLRRRAVESVDQVAWIPSWGRDRILGMIANRPDWCISRQRLWGVPVAVIYCEDCDHVFSDEEHFSRVTEIFSREGADAWFRRDAEDFLPPGAAQCPSCGGTAFRKEYDILDVWFDSSSSHAAVLGHRPDLPWPADLYLEGSDQHRGWFQHSLLVGLETCGAPPFRQVLTHGFVVDGEGKKLSKSLGNAVDPQEIFDSRGAEIVRVWVSMSDYQEDVKISEEILQRASEAYVKVRNTCRFLLGNLADYRPGNELPDLQPLDLWILGETSRLTDKLLQAYERYELHTVYHSIYHFCSLELSAIYLDIIKDRLYVLAPQSASRQAAQHTLFTVLNCLVRLMAPIYCFTADEIWEHMPLWEGKESSVHLSRFIDSGRLPRDAELDRRFRTLLQVRGEVLSALETARQDKVLGNSLQARIELHADGQLLDLLKQEEDRLADLFIVSAVSLVRGAGGAVASEKVEGLGITVTTAPGGKCPRCWHVTEDQGQDDAYPEVCARCARILSSLEES
jgi:isoleucyl-tRNA synthetase